MNAQANMTKNHLKIKSGPVNKIWPTKYLQTLRNKVQMKRRGNKVNKTMKIKKSSN